MALNFPANPSDGDIYESYVWNATVGAWQAQAAAGGGSIEVSSTAPLNPSAGDLWWDPDNGNLYIYYDDGTTGQWVAANGPQVFVGTSAPAGYQGQLWFDSTEGKTYIYYDDGTTGQWVSAIGGSLSGNVIQVVNATTNTLVSTTSTSYQNTDITATITPSSASNKILVLVSAAQFVLTSSGSSLLSLFRGDVSGTNLGQKALMYFSNSSSDQQVAVSFQHLDSPNTTSAVTYTVGIATSNTSNTAQIRNNQSITLMEIAG